MEVKRGMWLLHLTRGASRGSGLQPRPRPPAPEHARGPTLHPSLGDGASRQGLSWARGGALAVPGDLGWRRGPDGGRHSPPGACPGPQLQGERSPVTSVSTL